MEVNRVQVVVDSEWAEFFVAEREPIAMNGRMRHSATWTCLSSYGSFGHYWHDMGEPLSEFVQGVSSSYLLSKIAKKETLPELAIEAVRSEVLSYRKENRITKETAREAWNEIAAIESEAASGEVTCYLLYQSSELSFINDWDFTTRDFCGDAKQFVKKLWPAFVAELKRQEVNHGE